VQLIFDKWYNQRKGMRKKKFISAALIVLGAGLFIFGSYISRQAAQRELQISQIEQSEQGRRRPLIGPVRKSHSLQSAQTTQGKLAQAEQTVAASQTSANWLRGIGIVVIAAGLGYFFLRDC
jgi:hypothetical protein